MGLSKSRLRSRLRSWVARVPLLVHQTWVVVQETLAGFVRNDDLRQASSLAFYTTLALIPALLLLTYMLSLGLGGSTPAMQRTADFVEAVIPEFGEVILREVGTLTRQHRSLGLLNLAILLWSLTPLVAAFRGVFNTIFRVSPRRSLWVIKALDVVIAALFLVAASLMAGLGLLLKLLHSLSVHILLPSWVGTALPLLLTVGLLLAFYATFTPRVRLVHLLAGTLVAASLLMVLKPAFGLFLTFNPGYGITFGSFKSLFIVILWIYYASAVLLLGAETIAALHRSETLFIHRLMRGRKDSPLRRRSRFLVQMPAGGVFFREGETSSEMYHLLSGRVSIRSGKRELALIEPGTFFGEMSFLLGASRSATAAALEPCECIVIHEQNVEALMREFPGTIRDMLTEMARRLRDSAHPQEADPA